MATKYRSLLFKCDLIAANNTALKAYTLDIEFLDIENKTWRKLVTRIETKKGLLSHTYEIPVRLAKEELITRLVRDCMSEGSLPMFRIVKSNQKKTLIISEAPAIFFDEDNLQIAIDFQKLWLLDESLFIKKNNSIIIASPIYLYGFQKDFLILEEENRKLNTLTKQQETDLKKVNEKHDSQLKKLHEHLNEHEETESLLKQSLDNSLNEIADLKEQLSNAHKDDTSPEVKLLIKTLEDKTNEIESLLKKLNNQNEKLIDLQEEIEILKSSEVTKDELTIRVKELEKLVANYEEKTAIIQYNLTEKSQEIEMLKKEISILKNDTSKTDKLKKVLLEKTNTIKDLQKTQNELIKEKQSIFLEVKKTKNDLQTQQNSIDDLVEKVKISQQLVSEKNHEIATLTQNTAVKEIEISKLETKVTEIQSYVDAENPNKLDAKKVYSSIINDIAIADAEMDNSRFKMANISLNLKATVEKGPQGTLFGLVDFESAKDINAAAISDISIDIVPNTTSIKSKNTVPNIIGLTETAARKIITNYGLKLDVVYQPTDNPKFIEGQAIKQIPEVGSEIVQGQEVIVIFAKPLKN
ncbi:PASTA domain-containing protein [Tenacibaculum soleae]|uniref:PASTA domain-containing protein n=1 Tax=Tenacibaculum soleae TaxID=447689 RepID=UPI0026E3185B|nr:PASTA domain-containing protein [Tenacibaculum soleae]MDO6743881.1 PASTA domain-containing protein [Tenacibaculum soleae]